MTNDNNQQNTQQNAQVDGDVLGQLAANQATVKDVFQLEKGMDKTLNKIEKNQTKANAVLIDLQREIKKDNKVLLSVDTKLQQIINTLTNISATNTKSNLAGSTPDFANTTVNYSNQLDDITDLLSEIVNSDVIKAAPNYSDVLNSIHNRLLALDGSKVSSNIDYTNILNNIYTQLVATDKDTSASNSDYTDILNDIYAQLIVLDKDNTIDINIPDYTDILTSIDSNLLDVRNQISVFSLDTLVTTVSEILSAVGDTNDLLTEIKQHLDSLPADSTVDLHTLETIAMDTLSYVNDCSSYLDEIRELLKNIDDRQATRSSGGEPTPDDATKVDSLSDINETLIKILDAINKCASQRGHADNRPPRDETERWHPDFSEIERLLKELQEREEAEKDRTLSQDAQDAIDGLLSNLFKGYDVLSGETLKKITGIADKWGTGDYITKDLVGGIGGALGDVAGGAISTAINAVVPGLGSLIGNAVDKAITKSMEALGEWLSYFANHARETRDALIKAALDKIKQDVKDMATYSIDIQRTSLDKIYNVWDQNLSTINATQGYTKEALNSLQDSVAQRLQHEGYGNVINAADYVTQLTNTLNSKLGGELAEAFAAQNLILQKAVPELDLSAMAADFAAIYTNAEKQGRSGEAEMINAMNQIAGATKALEEVTGGNNQFITQVGTFLKKAEEVVIRSGGTTDQIIELTTQMMAAEAPLAALTPQLGGFTNTIIDALMNSNESTAVALRAITHDIDNTIGVSMTDFTNSFMRDTQGTLTAVYQAIDTFINTNANEGARQEFLQAMQSVFGLQASQIAQIDFGDIANQIASASFTTNTKALTAAENLVRSGETTTWEDQLVNNTTNQLLATNAVRDTIDNKLMRKLETNELDMERAVYALESTQTVDFAEKTMAFLTNIADIITGLLDPLGLLSGLTSIADVWNSFEIDKASYELVTTASSIGSTVTTAVDDMNADLRTHANTWGNAQDLAIQAMTKTSTDMMGILSPAAMLAQSITGTGVNQGQAEAAVNILQNSGVTDTFDELMTKHTETTIDAEQAIAEAQAAEMHNQSMELQAQRMQQAAARERQEKAEANQTVFDTRRMEALQQQRAQQAAEAAMVTANHDNIEAIRESVSKLDELSNYLSPILDENRNQSGLLQSLADKVDQLVHTLTNRASQPTVTSPTPNVNTSYNERDRIYGPIKTW